MMDGILHMLPIGELRPNPLNPRGPELDQAGLDELANSIQIQGILQPLLVTPDRLVVAGHRRLAAAQMVGLTTVPVLIRDMNETEQLDVMLIENIQREALSPLQEARAFKRLIDGGRDRSDVARAVGVNKARVQSRLQLLQLDPEVQERFGRGELPMTLAPVLVKVGDRDKQRRLATIAGRRSLTVPALEQIALKWSGELAQPAPKPRPAPTTAPAQVSALGSAGRQDMLKMLRSANGTTVPVARLADLFEATCCACGMGFSGDICSACPLLDAMRAVGREVGV
jgi:ParB family chromosome partitioning protein